MLVLRGSSTCLYSKERVTQGDPLPMFMYAIGTLPLIHSLNDPGRWTQLWYADDASTSGTLPELRNWFNQLCSSYGPSFGYYPEPTKSFVVINERWKSDTAVALVSICLIHLLVVLNTCLDLLLVLSLLN